MKLKIEELVQLLIYFKSQLKQREDLLQSKREIQVKIWRNVLVEFDLCGHFVLLMIQRHS